MLPSSSICNKKPADVPDTARPKMVPGVKLVGVTNAEKVKSLVPPYQLVVSTIPGVAESNVGN